MANDIYLFACKLYRGTKFTQEAKYDNHFRVSKVYAGKLIHDTGGLAIKDLMIDQLIRWPLIIRLFY